MNRVLKGKQEFAGQKIEKGVPGRGMVCVLWRWEQSRMS